MFECSFWAQIKLGTGKISWLIQKVVNIGAIQHYAVNLDFDTF